MTEINYENGVVVVSQYGVSTIRFRPHDLNYESRMEITEAVMDMQYPKEGGGVGFLKRQPAEVRQTALEEALGVSFPRGAGEEFLDAVWDDDLVLRGDYDE